VDLSRESVFFTSVSAFTVSWLIGVCSFWQLEGHNYPEIMPIERRRGTLREASCVKFNFPTLLVLGSFSYFYFNFIGLLIS